MREETTLSTWPRCGAAPECATPLLQPMKSWCIEQKYTTRRLSSWPQPTATPMPFTAFTTFAEKTPLGSSQTADSAMEPPSYTVPSETRTLVVNIVNNQASDGLHVLASKPSCFKSGANISGWRNILYNWISVDQLKPESIESLNPFNPCIQSIMGLWDAFLKGFSICKKKSAEATNKNRDLERGVNEEIQPTNIGRLQANQSAGEPSTTKFPKNDSTCIHFFKTVFSAIMIILELGGLFSKKKRCTSLEECEPSTTEFPPNYSTCINFFTIVLSLIMFILECGFPKVIKKIREKKQKHIWSVQVLQMFLQFYPVHYLNDDAQLPFQQGEEYIDVIEERNPEIHTHDSKYMSEEVIHLAAKNGVIEILKAIYDRFPTEMRSYRNPNGKNVVHLAAQHRQSEVYMFLLKNGYYFESLFRAADNDGNSALHLAATGSAPKFWHINGAALQMQWEVEWYKFVKESMPLHFFALYNNEGKTASTIFEENHKDLVQKGKDWLYSTSQSCTLVAALIATVAFATAAIIPGSNGNDNGLVEKEKVSFIFAISSLIAVSLSTISVIMFLAILTARFDIDDYFGSMFPWKLLIGLSSLYSSIIAMLISFCTGSSYFIINHHLPNKAILLYTLILFPVPFILAIVHLPLYYDLLQVLLKIVPKRKVHVDLCD